MCQIWMERPECLIQVLYVSTIRNDANLSPLSQPPPSLSPEPQAQYPTGFSLCPQLTQHLSPQTSSAAFPLRAQHQQNQARAWVVVPPTLPTVPHGTTHTCAWSLPLPAQQSPGGSIQTAPLTSILKTDGIRSSRAWKSFPLTYHA